MTEPADEIAAGQGRWRASHADREQVVGALQAAFVQGRLTAGELAIGVPMTAASDQHPPGPESGASGHSAQHLQAPGADPVRPRPPYGLLATGLAG